MWLGLRWFLTRGIDSQTDDQVENMLADAEYAQLAVFGRGLITLDGDAGAMHDDLRAIAERVWP